MPNGEEEEEAQERPKALSRQPSNNNAATTTTADASRFGAESSKISHLLDGDESSFPSLGLSQTPKPPSKCPLFCCFYAEFDNTAGPKICCQSPEIMNLPVWTAVPELETALADAFDRSSTTAMNETNKDDKDEEVATPQTSTRKRATSPAAEKQTNSRHNEEGDSHDDPSQIMSIFDSCSEYIITGSELTGNILNLSTHHIHILTRPTIISDEKYERNTLLFSVGFVLRRTEDPRPFRPALSKLALTLRDMEVESQFLSTALKDRQRPQIQWLLQRILVSLNSDACECNLLLGESNVLNLKLFRPPRTPAIPVQDHAVPILLRRDWQVQTYDWDLSINWVSLHIDGIASASVISKRAEVDMEMVRACLRVLKHHGVIALIDMFFYSNRYECTEKAASLFRNNDSKLLQEAIEFVIKRPTASGSSTAIPTIPHLGSDMSSEPLSTSPLTSQLRLLEQQHILSSSPTEPIKEGHLLGGVHRLNSSGSQQEYPLSSHLKREDYCDIKNAIPELISACSRRTSIGEIWLGFASGRLSSSSSVHWKKVFRLIDHRRLATFGLVHGLIRRVHNYPLLVDDTMNSGLPDEDKRHSFKQIRANGLDEKRRLSSRAASLMDGKHCDDELVSALDMSLEDIYSLFEGKRILSVFAPA